MADGKFFPALVREEEGWYARWRALGADNGWVDEYVREAALTRLSEDAEEQKHETLHDAWMMALRSRTGLVVWADEECAAFAAELEEWSGSAEEDREARRKIVFRFQVSDSDFQVRCAVPKGKRGLRALGQAAYVWSPLVGLRSDGALAVAWHGREAQGPDGGGAVVTQRATEARTIFVTLTRAEAEDFIRAGARNLRDAGYSVEGVDLAAPVTASLEIESGEADARPLA